MTKEKKNPFERLRTVLKVRLSLIVVVVTAIVLEGCGLMQYFYIMRESSDHRAGIGFIILLVIGLALVIFLMVRAVKSMKELGTMTMSMQKMEGELQIAHSIQMAMIPKTFPPFPERDDIDMFASIVPAKEVGGDLYDFYIKDEKLIFCIGDVSGKGVPASLVMAVTRSLFRTISSHENSPQKIVTTLNTSMSEMNENNMFVTFLAGILDLRNGHVRYCNAGHNAPVIIRPSEGICDFLSVEANVPIGIDKDMDFTEQEFDLRVGDSLFLYTDGVTEAENMQAKLYGEKRLLKALKASSSSAKEETVNVIDDVSLFSGEAPQSDDRTILAIRYTNPEPSLTTERHLILHNDIRQIPQLAGFIELVAEEAKLDQSMSISLNLALEEAVSNVIMYAYPEGSHGLVEIEAIIRTGRLDFIISDNGIPFDPTLVPDPDLTLGAEERGIGGLGIYMVRTIMDSVTYKRTDGKNILSMTKKI
ncbi:MAG: SpoIIE family protein phosphatase [Bacteroidales bacterium]|nr:SpoIIE family protein phosphatase [Bacteroidales bacterium]